MSDDAVRVKGSAERPFPEHSKHRNSLLNDRFANNDKILDGGLEASLLSLKRFNGSDVACANE